ncbi:Zinc transporter-like protein [Hapsidospora chrysogenum ATCC 11550]|uniref:Zinc transporter-like protein n=1 Tax=Hapsidospora chrysogenum (strain ATCC 11550 / CBS 779.69 / DSM 880 / IAM 14645 / JCM 23072 / IMI 49137) TaxID=857340 RepID=A0A086SXC3_HAPC1|nr:Zinc transporter-like protein [Hapsidospora chrysogenum ATCC 11550]
MGSFLAGALPLSMTLSSSQLRLLSSLGVGVLVGTCLIVIIPEGIGAASAPAKASHLHRVRTLARRSPWGMEFDPRDIDPAVPTVHIYERDDDPLANVHAQLEALAPRGTGSRGEEEEEGDVPDDDKHDDDDHADTGGDEPHDHHAEFPAFEIGISMILGFVLMFLIDRIPKHASESMRSAPQMRHISLDSLATGGGSAGSAGGDTVSSIGDEEADGLMGSLTPTPRRARSLATTLGLVIHAAADGIAMGASAASSNTKMSFVIFLAIMIHKAPAAFGLTSVLLRQGLSKRAARGHLVVFSLASPVGALVTWVLVAILGGSGGEEDSGAWWTGMLLLFSGGTFLYVAMHAMQDDTASHAQEHGHGLNGYAEGSVASQRKPKGPRMRDTLATIVGMLLPLLTQFGHHH